MKKIFTLFATIFMVASAFAQSITIVFKDDPTLTTSDGSKELTKVADLVEEGDNYISSISATKCFAGRSGYGIKLGSGKAAGSITITLNEAVKVKSIVYECANYSATEGKVNTTYTSDVDITNSESRVCSTLTDALNGASVSEISFSTAEKRAYLMEIKIELLSPLEEAQNELKETIDQSNSYAATMSDGAAKTSFEETINVAEDVYENSDNIEDLVSANDALMAAYSQVLFTDYVNKAFEEFDLDHYLEFYAAAEKIMEEIEAGTLETTPAEAFENAYQDEVIATSVKSVKTSTVKNGKYLENGKLSIVKNGKKYNVNGIEK